MALLFATGFNGITTATIGRRSAFAAITSVGANGRYGQAVRVGGGAAGYFYVATTGALTTVTAGVVVKPVSVFAGEDPDAGSILTFYDFTGTAAHLELKYDFTDECMFVQGPGPSYTEFYRGASSSLPASAWCTVECTLVVSNSAGAVTLDINGVTVYTGTSLDTRQGTHTPFGVDAVGIGGFGMGDLYCDAMYVRDDSTRLGPFRIDKVDTSANDSVQFTPLSSTNESNIDDGNSPDDDTSYNSSSTLNHRDTFTVAGWKATSHKVFAVIPRAVAKASAADGRELRTVVDNGSVVTGTSTSIDDTGYTEVSQVLEIATSTYASPEAAETGVNALKIGYEISA